MPPTRQRRTPASEAADQAAAREDADQAQTEPAPRPNRRRPNRPGRRMLSRAEQADLRRKLREKFH